MNRVQQRSIDQCRDCCGTGDCCVCDGYGCEQCYDTGDCQKCRMASLPA